METFRNGVIGAAPEDTRAYVGDHGFCRQGTTALFDVFIVNLDAGSYLHIITEMHLWRWRKRRNTDTSRISWSVDFV